MSKERAANAVPMPWFPDDAVIRRPPLLAEEEADILAMAPRNLNDPLSWKFSALKRTVALVDLPVDWAQMSEVW